MVTLYGIPNCDTMKKARSWLDEHGIDYEFHNYKKQGVPAAAVKSWVKQLGWEVLLNKRGTTWRQLDETTKANVDTQSAIAIMQENPSIIKRPVLDMDGQLQVGFSEDNYQKLFS
ncbi:MAG: ArsC family reductase [Gammaproteobacteria bacterium]